MNILAATVAEGGLAIRLQNGTKVSMRRDVLPPPGKAVLLGVRPEHLGARPVEHAVEGLMAEVRAVERLGADAFAHCRIAGETDPTGAELVLRLPGSASVAPGDLISVTIDEASAHLFDLSSGRRLAAA
jgi:sn-glycerol 3-phosphate transport system ATP-binding protein